MVSRPRFEPDSSIIEVKRVLYKRYWEFCDWTKSAPCQEIHEDWKFCNQCMCQLGQPNPVFGKALTKTFVSYIQRIKQCYKNTINRIFVIVCLFPLLFPSLLLCIRLAVICMYTWLADLARQKQEAVFSTSADRFYVKITGLRCDAFSSYRALRMFLRDLLPPSSGYKNEPSVEKWYGSESESHFDWQSVRLSWCRAPSGAHDQIFIFHWKLQFCPYGAPSLTRGRVCHIWYGCAKIEDWDRGPERANENSV
jgi:hypothetical protein